MAQFDHHAYFVVFSVQIVFSGYQIFTKSVLSGKQYDPVSFVLIRCVGTALVLYAMETYNTWLHPQKNKSFSDLLQHKKQLLILGLAMLCNVLGLVLALSFTTNAAVAIFQILRPIFAGLISQGLGLEDLTMPKWIGMGIALFGALMITRSGKSHDGVEANADAVLGFVFVCVHSIGQSSYVIMQPSLLDLGYSVMSINCCAFVVASGLVALLIPFPFHDGLWFGSTPAFYELALYSILLVGVYSYVAMGWAAQRIGGTVIMLFMLLQAFLTVIGGKLLLDEQLHNIGWFGAGAACILAGIALYVSESTSLWNRSETLPIAKVKDARSPDVENSMNDRVNDRAIDSSKQAAR